MSHLDHDAPPSSTEMSHLQAEAPLTQEISNACREATVRAASDDNPLSLAEPFDYLLIITEEKSKERFTFRILDFEEITIGRQGQNTPTKPDLDLTPLSTHADGISRLHAKITQQDRRLHIMDCGSRNGLNLNGRYLEPEQKRVLCSSDVIRLGRITLHIKFEAVRKNPT